MYQNVYTPIQHLRRPPVRSGGLCWTIFARKVDVAQWPQIHPATGRAYTSIQLVANATWFDLKLVSKDLVYSELPKYGNGGPGWDMTLSGYQGGSTDTQILSFSIMSYDEFVLMFKDKSGIIRFIGNEDKGAMFTPGYNSGDKDASRKASIQFVWQHTSPAPIYLPYSETIVDDVIVPPFITLGDFNDDLNNDFFN